MGASHTSGPWVAHCQDVAEGFVRGIRFWDIREAGKYRGDIATVNQAENIGGITIGERDANARLIAAAPDLLAALVDLMPANLCTDNPNIGDDEVVPIDFTMGELRAARAAIAKATGA